MDKSETKLRLHKKAIGLERQNTLAAPIKMIKTNNKIMWKGMNGPMKESMKMDGSG